MQGFTGNIEVYRDDCIVLHKFSEGEGVPVFVVPPHAGKSGNIAQNMIDHLAAAGKTVYAYELLSATKETSCISVYGLVQALNDCVDIIGGFADVVGLCQGAWLSSILTSLYQPKVNRLALFAGPINTKTGQKNVIEKYCQIINMDWHKSVVKAFGGVQPKGLQWAAFSMANPFEVYFKRYYKQAYAIWMDDKKKIADYERDFEWHDTDGKDLHGGWFIQALEFFSENKLYEGTWNIGSGVVPKLEAITCPVYVFAGGDDNITHPEQARGILDKVSSSEKYYTVFPKAGHTAVFARPSCIQQFMTQFYGGNQ